MSLTLLLRPRGATAEAPIGEPVQVTLVAARVAGTLVAPPASSILRGGKT